MGRGLAGGIEPRLAALPDAARTKTGVDAQVVLDTDFLALEPEAVRGCPDLRGAALPVDIGGIALSPIERP